MTPQPYEKYKDSGVEWLGLVPVHWEVKRVKHVADVINGYPFESSLFDSHTGHPLIRIRDLDQFLVETYYNGEFVECAAITSDDVLVGMDGDFNVGRWHGKGIGLLNQRMCCVRSSSQLITRLLEYSLPFPLKAINDITHSTTVKHLASSQVEKTNIAIPPPEEQQAIAAFLDRETAEIDALLAAKERMLSLMAEKRKALITEAVTRGLNPEAERKDSGVPWIGEIPAHWTIQKLGYLARIGNGSTPNRGNLEYWTNGTFPWIGSGAVNNEFITQSEEWVTELAVRECHLNLVPKGSVLMGIVGQGKTRGLAGILTFDSFINQNMAYITPNEKLSAEYLQKTTVAMYEYLRAEGDGSGGAQGAINCDQLSQVKICVPPLEEQRAIVAHIESETAKLDALKAATERTVALLKERRSALIAAAVTGQIRVQ